MDAAFADLVNRERLFPKLSAEHIERLRAFGRRVSVGPAEIIFDQGDIRGLYVVLDGRLEIVSPNRQGETHITFAEKHEFTGEVDILAGRRSLVRARAPVASELIEICPADLRRVVQTDPGPIPTLTISTPDRISSSVISPVTTLPAIKVTFGYA